MNRTYNYNSYESNCRPVRIKNVSSEENDIIDAVGDLVVKAFALFSSVAFKVCMAVLCLIGFIGVIGGVELGTLSIGTGIIAAVFMIFIEILCVCTSSPKRRK